MWWWMRLRRERSVLDLHLGRAFCALFKSVEVMWKWFEGIQCFELFVVVLTALRACTRDGAFE